GVGADLDEQELALDRALLLELDDLDDVDELVELLGHLLEREGVDVDDDGDPGDLGDLGRTDRERVDVERAAGEQARDAREHAGLVLHEDGQRVPGHAAPSSRRSCGSRTTRTGRISPPGPTWARCRARTGSRRCSRPRRPWATPSRRARR